MNFILEKSSDIPFVRKEKEIILMMSGGVDSSVCLSLLKKEGYSVLGITMKLPDTNCEDGAKVAHSLRIPHYFIDVRESFRKLIIEPFKEEYLSGKTPSPCTDCNEKIKFGAVPAFLSETFGIKDIATGHYAKIYSDETGYHLGRGRDTDRDQSYFLYGIKKEMLPYIHFPLEPYSKDTVRQIAADSGIETAEKPDSMELCFAGEGDYRHLLSHSRPGIIIDTEGKKLGEHKGIENYTVGQRKGLGVSAPYPLYVTDINPVTNTVTLGRREEGLVTCLEINRINILEHTENKKYFGKIRSNGNPKPCIIRELNNDFGIIEFDEPFFRPAKGQKTVLYDEKDNVVLGGTIC